MAKNWCEDRGRLGPSDEVKFGPRDSELSPEEIVERAHQMLKGRNMNPTRCKVKLVSISGGFYNDDKSRSVKFTPVTSGSEENKKFYSATPGGNFEFQVSGQAAESLGLDQAKIGSEFFVDFTPVSG